MIRTGWIEPAGVTAPCGDALPAIQSAERRGATYYCRRAVQWQDGESFRLRLSLRRTIQSVARHMGTAITAKSELLKMMVGPATTQKAAILRKAMGDAGSSRADLCRLLAP